VQLAERHKRAERRTEMKKLLLMLAVPIAVYVLGLALIETEIVPAYAAITVASLGIAGFVLAILAWARS
jgi:hypothetical protein